LHFKLESTATINKSEILKLVRSINQGLGDKALGDTQLEKSFDKWWPDLEVQLAQAEAKLKEAAAIPQTIATRPTEDILSELLELTRSIAQRQDAATLTLAPSSLGGRLGSADLTGLFGLSSPADAAQSATDRRIFEAFRRQANRNMMALGLLNMPLGPATGGPANEESEENDK
jgi:hypothetical protein